MADKNTVTEKPEEILMEERADMMNMFDNLPKDTFISVPDDNVVYIGLSGVFVRQIHHVRNFLVSLMKEEDYEKFQIDIARNFEEKDPSTWTPLETNYMIIHELIMELVFQASKQKVDRVYDKKIMGQIIEDNIISRRMIHPDGTIDPKGLDPLSLDEIAKRMNSETSNED